MFVSICLCLPVCLCLSVCLSLSLWQWRQTNLWCMPNELDMFSLVWSWLFPLSCRGNWDLCCWPSTFSQKLCLSSCNLPHSPLASSPTARRTRAATAQQLRRCSRDNPRTYKHLSKSNILDILRIYMVSSEGRGRVGKGDERAGKGWNERGREWGEGAMEVGKAV